MKLSKGLIALGLLSGEITAEFIAEAGLTPCYTVADDGTPSTAITTEESSSSIDVTTGFDVDAKDNLYNLSFDLLLPEYSYCY